MRCKLYRIEETVTTGDPAYGSMKRQVDTSFHIVRTDQHQEFIDDMECIKANNTYSKKVHYYLIVNIEDDEILKLKEACERAIK